MVWGGMTQIILGEGDDRFLVQIDLPGQSVEQHLVKWLVILCHRNKKCIPI